MINGQNGLLTRRQTRELGLSEAHIRAHLDGGRWQALNDAVICTHNGPLTRRQTLWGAVLGASGPVALAGLTGMEVWGVQGLLTPQVHLLVPKSAKPLLVPGIDVVIHESRRFTAADIMPPQLPVTSLERATIDAASWSPDIKTATRVAVAPIQQRLTTATRLREALSAAGQIKFGSVLRPFIADLEGGAEALSEVEFLKWCRRHGFPKPVCQVRQDSKRKRRYLDATFRRSDGSVLRAEIDGGVHLNLTTRWSHTAKDNDDVIAGRATLRFPSVALYSDDPLAISQLREALQISPTSAWL